MVLTAALFGKTLACQTNLRHDWGSGRTRVEPGPPFGVARTSSFGARPPSNLQLGCSWLFLPCPQRQQIDEEAVAPGRQFSDAAPGRLGGNARGQTLFRLGSQRLIAQALLKLAIGVANWSRK